MTAEGNLIILIYVLYLFRNIRFVPFEKLIIVNHFREQKILFPYENIKMFDKFLILLNPFKFFYPSFYLKFQDMNQVFFLKKTLVISKRLYFLIPIVVLIWINILLILPLSFYFMHIKIIIIAGIQLYLSILVLIFQLWYIKGKVFISTKTFMKLSVDYILCPPFAANAIRDISLEYRYA